MKIEIPLTTDLFSGLLTGKKLCVKTPEYEVTVYPPHYGIYFTHEQIAEIQRAARAEGAREVLRLMRNISDMKDRS